MLPRRRRSRMDARPLHNGGNRCGYRNAHRQLRHSARGAASGMHSTNRASALRVILALEVGGDHETCRSSVGSPRGRTWSCSLFFDYTRHGHRAFAGRRWAVPFPCVSAWRTRRCPAKRAWSGDAGRPTVRHGKLQAASWRLHLRGASSPCWALRESRSGHERAPGGRNCDLRG